MINFLSVFLPGTNSTKGKRYTGLNGWAIINLLGLRHCDWILLGKSPDELDAIIVFFFAYLLISLTIFIFKISFSGAFYCIKSAFLTASCIDLQNISCFDKLIFFL